MSEPRSVLGFWRYVVFGAALSAMATGFFRNTVAPALIYPNPAFQAYEHQQKAFESRRAEYQRRLDAYNGRLAANRPQVNRRQFEEALAGVRPLELVQDHNFRRIAGILRPDTPSYLRLRYLNYVFVEHAAFTEWMFPCTSGPTPVCTQRPELSVLDQPMQLQALLAGDTGAIHAPVIEQPPALVPFMEQPAVAPAPSLPAPRWVGWLTAALAALFFSIGYVIAGLVYFHGIDVDYRDEVWLHPLKGSPPFSILGWLVWIAALPGLSIILLVQFLFTDLSPTLRSFAGRFTKKKFRDEFERLEATLLALKTRAIEMGNKTLEDQINSTSERVRVAQTREQLAQLGASLEDVRTQLESIAEVDVLVAKK